MQTIQLYIQEQRVELFKDESVTITDSIQNVKDIEKVFTSFTQSFSVPASKTNNKIFKHYYNFDIVGGFDARKKVAATIELNNLPFRTGKIKLEGVDMKNNKAHTYRITFFGDIVELKDKLGEKKLSDLDLSAYDLTYNASTIQTKLTTAESSTNHIIAPLITHSQRLYYNSAEDIKDTGNLYYKNTGEKHGAYWDEFKYAIRVNKIIQAIQFDFNLSFSTDFFNNSSVEEMDNLFLWLHRKSGAVEDLSGSANNYETLVDGFTVDVTGTYFTMPTTYTIYNAADPDYIDEFSITLTTTSTNPYSFKILDENSNTVYSSGNVTGTSTADGAYDTDFTLNQGSTYRLYITASTAITFSNIQWACVYFDGVNSESKTFSTGSFTTSSAFTFNVSNQMPDMKILDFLTGLFKIFNLTAYVINNTSPLALTDKTIVVKPLDDFYTGTDTYDITEFVDVNSSKVDVALPYREIEFAFKDTKTFLANKFGELNNREWGKLSYRAGENDLAGQLYKVEAPFGHMLFERLTDIDTGTQKDIQWGYSVDKSQNAYLGSPLLFYPIHTSTGNVSLATAFNDDREITTVTAITSVNLPSNTVSFSSATNDFQLNFNREVNEWTGDTSFADTLYLTNYNDYISSVFNTKQRLTKVKAYLPMRILLNYSLGDRFVIAGNQYKINSISTNLLTGESNLELINDL